MASDLLVHGVAVIRVFDEDRRREWNHRLFSAMDEFPEYIRTGRDVQRVLGGFGALGNPSSFHHPAVRELRRYMKRTHILPLFDRYARAKFRSDAGDVRVETLFDRLCVRYAPFRSPTDEVWHRDVYSGGEHNLRDLPHTLPGNERDIIVGGWTNLDHRDQAFVGLVNTHEDDLGGAGGFDVFTPEQIKKYRFPQRLAAQAPGEGRTGTYGTTIRCNEEGEIIVPPGHAVLFLQRLVHSVKSGKQPDTPALRVFHGYRLTREAVPLFDLEGVLRNGSVPRIPSGQVPPMYSSNHYSFMTNPSHAFHAWARTTFRPECLFKRTSSKGVRYHTPGSEDDRNPAANVGRYMPSLAEMGLWTDEYAYSQDDVAVLSPQRLGDA